MTTVLALASCTQATSPASYNYPADPAENFAPTLSTDRAYRNLALNRAAYSSSSHDYNLTAQLATDGIIGQGQPAYIKVSTSMGPVAKDLMEWMFDMKTNTRFSLEGASEYLRLDFCNYLPVFDNIMIVASVTPQTVKEEYFGAPGQEAGQINPGARRAPRRMDVNWTLTLEGSADGQEWIELDRVKGKGSDIFTSMSKGKTDYPSLRLLLDSDNGESWEIKDWDFYADGVAIKPVHDSQTEVYYRGDLIQVTPASVFSSAWMSAGQDEEWLYVDLGARCSIKEIKTEWLSCLPCGKIQISDNSRDWKDIADIAPEVKISAKARYVRLLCLSGGPYILSELEVFGTGGVVAEAKAQPEPNGKRLDLAGGNWKIQRASLVGGMASEISSVGYDDAGWLVATVPGTALVSYLNVGAVPDPNYSDNEIQISDSFFNSDFWYRDEFTLPADFEGRNLVLNFDGINWKAEIYVNGTAVGRIEGAFIRAKFDVTDLLHPGVNSVAVKIIKNAFPGSIREKTAQSSASNGGILGADNPTFHASVGWDWISTIRGRNIGIWNDVYLTASGDVTIQDPFVRTTVDGPDCRQAGIFISATLKNNSTESVSGRLCGSFGPLSFSENLSLEPGEEKSVTVPQLKLDNPKLWWPAGYGDPELYDVSMSFVQGESVSDECAFKSGVREMTYRYEDNGVLSVYVNGRRFVGRGGNWGFSESNLRYRGREYDAAVRYHADMNFTMIRNWVGQTGDEEFYEACDRHGIMVWQDFWLANPWDGPDPYDEAMFIRNAEDYIKRIRNHASIAIYCGRNEGMPTESLDKALRELTDSLHPGSHYIPHSAAGMVSGGGPYRALPVENYFHLNGHDRMHSERGMPNVMNYEDLLRTIPEDRLWPHNNIWGIHDFTLRGAQYASSFIDMVNKGFGEPGNAREFTELAQWINYDGYRAIFEGRSEHRRGMLLWMSHPCWPSMVWQTYDYFFEPTAAYFGCKKASEPLHIQYNSYTGNVELVNISAGDVGEAQVSAEVLAMTGEKAMTRQCSVNSKEDSTIVCFPLEIPSDITDVYFIRLKLLVDGRTVSENFYWKGKENGNYQALRTLPKAQVKMTVKTVKDGKCWKSTVSVTNKSDVPALMLRLKACDKTGNLVTPVIYSDNYFFLMQGETKTVDVEVSDFDSRGTAPKFEISGFNVL